MDALRDMGVVQHGEMSTPFEQEGQAEVTTEYNGKRVRLPGYLVPLDYEGLVVKSALLVPYVGACIHVPPPPPNQLVRLLMKDLPETGGSCVPAVIQGTLRAEETQYEVVVIDHSLPMWSAWTLETNAVSVVDSYQSDNLFQH